MNFYTSRKCLKSMPKPHCGNQSMPYSSLDKTAGNSFHFQRTSKAVVRSFPHSMRKQYIPPSPTTKVPRLLLQPPPTIAYQTIMQFRYSIYWLARQLWIHLEQEYGSTMEIPKYVRWDKERKKEEEKCNSSWKKERDE